MTVILFNKFLVNLYRVLSDNFFLFILDQHFGCKFDLLQGVYFN